ncbi:uncharacterized protein B0I36DRAFT_389717 [Microdochium trichocladiopsis]|uniref:Uncharacterized protein n=1 Tax=Microdochium trichocladiopsis TaxID=1682393 RepID=A0A9P8XR07_9PEZI|nr:uncharacterized protein B0I36DRAFT_389717 [Microdochium trichocladiopsis]KAH7012252.1 hypothetical protein B0I36DRAFT_389717 [Microdochium trichocladiopsis]
MSRAVPPRTSGPFSAISWKSARLFMVAKPPVNNAYPHLSDQGPSSAGPWSSPCPSTAWASAWSTQHGRSTDEQPGPDLTPTPTTRTTRTTTGSPNTERDWRLKAAGTSAVLSSNNRNGGTICHASPDVQFSHDTVQAHAQHGSRLRNPSPSYPSVVPTAPSATMTFPVLWSGTSRTASPPWLDCLKHRIKTAIAKWKKGEMYPLNCQVKGHVLALLAVLAFAALVL